MGLISSDSLFSSATSGLRSVFSRNKNPNQPSSEATGPALSISQLMGKLENYLNASEIRSVKEAYRFSDEKHLGQMRRSGEPYISHPIAVAEICADWKLDSEAIMAALLHDVMEDQDVSQDELTQRFGPAVAALVDGLSKLEKFEFQSQAEAQAENFRKMLLAMSRDIRVILIKLADRLHNMSTLGAMPAEKRVRIARETVDVYIPIALRLGLNDKYRELQDLSFSHLFPLRYRTLDRAVSAARGNRREIVGKILAAVKNTLKKYGIPAEVHGREKTLFSIYEKMVEKHLSFSQVLDIYGFRIVVKSLPNCYVTLGALHGLFKPIPGKFKDYIAIPKLNGYQSLHTTLIGPYGTPVEFQIRTHDMHKVAESGVAAHWLYKNSNSFSELQQHTHALLQSLLDIQKQTGDSVEFLEHVKVDLFPDSVYVFTPKSRIIALPRGATALDFAYTIHTRIGDHASAVRINHENGTLGTELRNGDIVEIFTDPNIHPNPSWLRFIRTGKARSAIRHTLRTLNQSESIAIGQHLLQQALAEIQLAPQQPPEIIEYLLQESSSKSIDEIYLDIGTGKRIATLVARHILGLAQEQTTALPLITTLESERSRSIEPISIFGSEGVNVQLANCCLPIPGDPIMGQLQRDQGLIVHTHECEQGMRQRKKEPERWIEVSWGEDIARRFETRIKLTVSNEKGVLARLACEIANGDANISQIAMEGATNDSCDQLRMTLQVTTRDHLARILRSIRRLPGISRVMRECD